MSFKVGNFRGTYQVENNGHDQRIGTCKVHLPTNKQIIEYRDLNPVPGLAADCQGVLVYITYTYLKESISYNELLI